MGLHGFSSLPREDQAWLLAYDRVRRDPTGRTKKQDAGALLAAINGTASNAPSGIASRQRPVGKRRKT